MLWCSIALAITVTACPHSASHLQNRRSNPSNINTNDIKEKLSMCTSGNQRDIAPHILNLGTTWRKVVSFTNTIICHNKCVALYIVISILLLIIILDFIFRR
jgi:hypothetical protein